MDSQIDYIDSFIQTDEMIVYEIGAGDGLLLNRVKAKKNMDQTIIVLIE